MLHTKKSLALAVAEIVAGKRNAKTELEKFVALTTIRKQGVKINFDVEAATRRSLYAALRAQGYLQMPEAVKASPAGYSAWMNAVDEQLAKHPPVKGLSYEPVPALPQSDHAAAAIEIDDLERACCMEPPVNSEARRRYPERIAAETEARREKLAEAFKTGNYGRLGRVLDALAPADRARAQLIERARELGVYGKLGALLKERQLHTAGAGFESARPLGLQPKPGLVHPLALGGKIAWLCEVKEGDRPPAKLADGLGNWAWQELRERAHGCYVFEAA